MILNAVLEVRQTDTNQIRKALTGARGDFTITNLDPGRYEVQAIEVVATAVGNSGRDILNGPGRVTVNSTLSRLGDGREEPAAVPMVALPVRTVDTANAATITSADDSRPMQFGLRCSF